MFVLGIDPGLTRCGFGAVRRIDATRSVSHGHGVLRTDPDQPLPQRLASMHTQLHALMERMGPDVVVVERVFFQVNARTAMAVAQASGLALALAAGRGCTVVQYTSNEVKLAVTGDGAADKRAVQSMVKRLLDLPAVPSPPDAADALALALCHLAIAPQQLRVAASLGASASTHRSGQPPGQPRPLRIARSLGGVAIAASSGASPRPSVPGPTVPRPSAPLRSVPVRSVARDQR
jgi:crossover junction endodeoxyribonuclease RuvC